MNKKAILLVNLGSPDNCTEKSVSDYLNQFLMDPSVIQLPWLIRRLLVSLLVLPKRPKQSAKAYQQIWTEQGSPLIVISQQLKKSIQKETEHPVFMAMRYGNPSIESQLLEIAKNKDIKDVHYIPLYPHYADSTVKTSIDEVERVIKDQQLNLNLSVKQPFYNEDSYINALVESAFSFLFERASAKDSSQTERPHLLFSYHGLPESHLKSADPTNNHCLTKENCCATQSLAHSTCYKHQVLETTRLFVEKSGLQSHQYSISFQSRLGRAKWLEPSTIDTLKSLANKGIKELVVICPAFITDCLETLEEIAIQGEEIFIQAGGRSLKLIPCLNNQPSWVNLVSQWCNEKPK